MPIRRSPKETRQLVLRLLADHLRRTGSDPAQTEGRNAYGKIEDVVAEMVRQGATNNLICVWYQDADEAEVNRFIREWDFEAAKICRMRIAMGIQMPTAESPTASTPTGAHPMLAPPDYQELPEPAIEERSLTVRVTDKLEAWFPTVTKLLRRYGR